MLTILQRKILEILSLDILGTRVIYYSHVLYTNKVENFLLPPMHIRKWKDCVHFCNEKKWFQNSNYFIYFDVTQPQPPEKKVCLWVCPSAYLFKAFAYT